ncbi:unnamed protein product [Caenorhabditis angaria]|uniref:Uncharacterized protein n=1 Tax=Caenorhabditis angaria TaxID=860376 RepID=A0A9P1N609_9PELO|nr:unnamed protein product [Caenorhabditis angaria]
MVINDYPSSSGASSSTSSQSRFGIDWAKWFPPLTSRTFLSHYLPASGAVSHTLYTIHLFSPNIISGLFPTGDLAVSNTILFNANVGLGFYVYFRRHLHRVNPWERVEFSVLTSTLFNFGSLLAAVLIKAIFPAKTQTWLKTLFATSLSVYLLSRAYRYIGLLDAKSSRSSVSPVRNQLRRKITPQQQHQKPLEISTSPPSIYSAASTRRESTPQPMLLTPTATTISEFEDDSPPNEKSTQNYRYLHSYALNNLNSHQNHRPSSILRRTTMNSNNFNPTRIASQTTPTKMSQPISFVTPEPSLQDAEFAVYSPLTPTMTPIKSSKKRVIEKDTMDRVLDFAQIHGPLLLIPFGFTCFVTGSLPMWTTIRFIFFE